MEGVLFEERTDGPRRKEGGALPVPLAHTGVFPGHRPLGDAEPDVGEHALRCGTGGGRGDRGGVHCPGHRI